MFTIDQIDDYQNRITEQQKKALIEHCNKYKIAPVICAWYENMEDFYDDWCQVGLGYSKEEARDRFEDGLKSGEFKRFAQGKIVRLEM